MKKISVVIQTYNQKNYIADCINSVLKQEQSLIKEILIWDDCSTDGTSKIVAEFARENNLISHIRPKTNIGAFDSFKSLHMLAKGEYIAHLDGDDYWIDEKLLRQFEELERDKDLIAVGCISKVIRSDNKQEVGQIPEKCIVKPAMDDIVLRHPVFILSSLMYRNTSGVWNLPSKYASIDWRLFISLISQGSIKVIPTQLVVYRLNCGISTKMDLSNFEIFSLRLASIYGFSSLKAKILISEILGRRFIRQFIGKVVNLPLEIQNSIFEIYFLSILGVFIITVRKLVEKVKSCLSPI